MIWAELSWDHYLRLHLSTGQELRLKWLAKSERPLIKNQARILSSRQLVTCVSLISLDGFWSDKSSTCYLDLFSSIFFIFSIQLNRCHLTEPADHSSTYHVTTRPLRLPRLVGSFACFSSLLEITLTKSWFNWMETTLISSKAYWIVQSLFSIQHSFLSLSVFHFHRPDFT